MDFVSGISNTFSDLGNNLVTGFKTAILGGGSTPPNSSPAPQPGVAQVGASAASPNGPAATQDNTLLYVAIGVAIVAVLIVIVKK